MAKLKSCAAALVLVASVAAPSPALAQRIVYDPSNYAQNLLTASRALEQIRNQLRQIEQNSAMLRQNPLQMAPELTRELEDAQALIEAGEGLAFEIERLSDDLEALYPETWADFDLDAVRDRSRQWRLQSRRSLERAMRAEAGAIGSLEASRDRVDRALTASAGAEGQTGAVQAGNQLLGVAASELAHIRALVATQGRALETERLRRLSQEERALEIQRRAFPAELPPGGAPARSAF